LRTTGILIVVLFVAVGAYLLSAGHAATFWISGEPENGTLKAPAGVISDTTASGGKSVLFSTPTITYGTFQNPYKATSLLNAAIPSNPLIDPSSATIMAHNFDSTSVFFGNVYEGAHTIYQSSSTDPTYNLSFSAAWGTNPFDITVTSSTGSGKCNPLHIPNSATKPGNHDKWMLIYDTTKPGLICEIWQADKSTGVWTGAWGGVYDIKGDGNKPLAGYGTGSGLAASSLMIRASEVRAGVITHPLVFPSYCNRGSVWRAPATGTDGFCTDSLGLVEGMRFQLDPTFNCSVITGGIERMVCVALQKYGVYDGDNSGVQTPGVTPLLGVMFETDDPADPNRLPWAKPGDYTRSGGLYNANGVTADFPHFTQIPVTRMRLLQN